ncbi:oxidoreductase, putative [Metarhizium acridum CQMa 102]|uniref:Oxidoreductase, putative n=1 Tax=Metarhizium acridum (strain CQMa 102) TaxID=655827 RepID=E9DVS9_METAQ|nr:oxidoreductase, putative [Metarhizium acridum CQMa 102]EFY92126.1 oxidoreductase, putative [Metarhizium acridum CQMa 102]
MGLAIANCLIKSGANLAAWNRSVSGADSLLRRGVTMAASPAACIAASPTIITCLISQEITKSVLEDVAKLAGKTIINLANFTNCTPEQSRLMANLVQHRGPKSYIHGAVMVLPVLWASRHQSYSYLDL